MFFKTKRVPTSYISISFLIAELKLFEIEQNKCAFKKCLGSVNCKL